MKKTIPFLLAIFLVNSCSTNSDGTKDTVPLPPTNLTGNVISTTQINLSWTDNSTNETGFKIERKTGLGTYEHIVDVMANETTYQDTSLSQNTIYTYRVCSLNQVGNSTAYTNEFTLRTISPPQIGNLMVKEITTNSALCSASINAYEGPAITARGFVWNTNKNPTIDLTTKSTDGTGTGNFNRTITGLTDYTIYYVRPYATNSSGVFYGNENSFFTPSLTYSYTQGSNITDIDGNIYPTIITSRSQTWMQKNLNVSHYRNGDVIPEVTDPTAWVGLTSGAWCYLDNKTTNGTIFGKLYNWYAINDPRGLAPAGYHIPTQAEWINLTLSLGGNSVAGGKMRETGSAHWVTPNAGATNSSGFTGLPGGQRWGSSGAFGARTTDCNLWSSDGVDASVSINFKLIESNLISFEYISKKYGLSVRCLKD